MSFFSVHAHFHQPPRTNPFSGKEIGAERYADWNLRVTEECYAPNAKLGNFELLSFSVGSTLLEWLAEHAAATYRAILEADRMHTDRVGVGNAVAVPLNHVVLPLARKRDKITEVRWGIADFLHRFGRRPLGMWLPEMAVDLETLQVLHDEGISFTILSQAQTVGAGAGAGAYWVELPAGERIGVYVRDDELSNQAAFDLPQLGGAGRWARDVLASRTRSAERLTVIAVAGESFGHHHRGEEQFLHWLLSYEAPAVGYQVTALGFDFCEYPPRETIGVREGTSWSCPHGLERWAAGCECTPGPSNWKGVLRRAFDHLSARLDEALVTVFESARSSPWALRDDYIRVLLRQFTEREYFDKHGLDHLDEHTRERLLKLLQASYCAQRAFNSVVFHVEDLARPEPMTAIANALRAAQLAEEATDDHFVRSLKRDLAPAHSSPGGQSAADMLDGFLAAQREDQAG